MGLTCSPTPPGASTACLFLFVGVRCPVDVIIARRNAGELGREGTYATSAPGGEVPAPVLRWEEEVHRGKSYDLEVDTSQLSPGQAAEQILATPGTRHRGGVLVRGGLDPGF